MKIESEIIVSYQRKYLFLLLFGAFVLSLGATDFIINAFDKATYCSSNYLVFCPKNPYVYIFIGWIGLIFFGILGAFALLKYCINPNVIKINRDGFISKNGFIKWDDVIDFNLTDENKFKFLTFKVIKKDSTKEFIYSLRGTNYSNKLKEITDTIKEYLKKNK